MKTDGVKTALNAACAASMALVALVLWLLGEPRAAYLTVWMTVGSTSYALFSAWRASR